MNKQIIRNTILRLYKDDKTIVNDDARLLEGVWLALGWNEHKSLYDNLSRLPRPESISRRRRELFNEGLIEYSPEALKTRENAFKNELEQHSYVNPVFAQNPLDKLDDITRGLRNA